MNCIPTFVALLCLITSPLFAGQLQNKTKDIDLFLDAANEFLEEGVELAKADSLALIALELSKTYRYPLGQCRSHHILGRSAILQQAWDRALQSNTKALNCYQDVENSRKEAEVLLDLSYVEENRFYYPHQTAYAKRALGLFQVNKDTAWIAYASSYLGDAYLKVGKVEKSKEAYRAALYYYLQQGDTLNWAVNQYSLANLFYNYNLGIDSALYFSETALKVFEQNEEIDYRIAGYNLAGGIYYEQEKYVKAKEYFLLSLSLAEKIADTKNTVKALVNLGELSVSIKDITKAKDYYEKAQQLFDLSKGTIIEKTYLDRLRDSISAAEAWADAKVEMRLGVIKLRYSLIGTFIILCIIGFYTRKLRIRQRLRFKAEMKSEKLKYEIEIEELINEIVQSSSLAQIEGEERERIKIARLVHNTVASQITGIRFNLESQIATLKRSNQSADALENINIMLKEAYNNARDIKRLLEKGGVDWLEEIDNFYDSIDRSGVIEINYSKHGLRQGLSVLEDHGLAIYQIILTLTTNVLLHAKAKALNCQLNLTGDSLNIILDDNGRGFDQKVVIEGSGIKSVKEMVKEAGGEIEISSIIGTGTTIVIAIPIES